MTEAMDHTEIAIPSSSPSRLLTFLLADIRGYTAYADQRGDEAGADLTQRFLGLCREVIEGHDGTMFGSAGDQALSAFLSARHALRAAVALQARLADDQAQHPERPLVAGIGLDAGEAIQVGDDFRGGAINLAARLCSIAGPGEIFASEGVIHLARKTEGVTFLDRGEVTLKGLTNPIRVIQIAPEGTVRGEPVPLQPILVAHPTNLPDDPTPFIGRAREIAEITELVKRPNVRLLTLTGPGGTGKTRLALQVGASLLHTFRDGAFFVSLGSLTDPGLVPGAMASVLGVKEEPGRELNESLTDFLRDKQLLLVLDNFEHLAAAASFVSSLLESCRALHVLVTSRIPLHLTREQEYPVPPLAIPDPRHLPPLDQLSQYEAVALFIERARATKPSFEINADNAPAVAEICFRLDGLPLAIELAAARSKLFPPQALLQRLDSRLKLLTGGAKDRPSRQQTLRGAIDWSYSLLSPEEQTLFGRLSVFAGGCDFEAAEAVCNPRGELDLLEGMTSLVDKSLLRQEGEEESRFLMLETIREYAAEKLAERGEEAVLRDAHARHILALGEEAARQLRGPHQLAWLNRLEIEHDNIRAALSWFQDRREFELGQRLAGKVWQFWQMHGHLAEAERWLRAVLANEEGVAPEVRGRARWALGIFAGMQGRLDEAEDHTEKSLADFREAGNQTGIASALANLGIIAEGLGRYDDAARHFKQSLEIRRAEGDRDAIAASLMNLAGIAKVQGRFEEAMAHLVESLAVAREIGDPRRIATALGVLGYILLEQGRYADAQANHQESLAINRTLGDQYSVAAALEGLGVVALEQEHLAEARGYFQESLAIRRTLGDQQGIATSLHCLGTVAVDEVMAGSSTSPVDSMLRDSLKLQRDLGDQLGAVHTLERLAELAAVRANGDRAAHLWATAEALRTTLGSPRAPSDLRRHQRAVALAGSGVTPQEWDLACDDGRAMSLEAAIAYALDEPNS